MAGASRRPLAERLDAWSGVCDAAAAGGYTLTDSIPEAGLNQVVQAQQPHELALLIHHGKHRDGFSPVVFHLLQGLHHQNVGIHRDRISGHQILCRQLAPGFSTMILQGAA